MGHLRREPPQASIMVLCSSTRIVLVMSGIALVSCGSNDRATPGDGVENSATTKPNYEPAILTAFADKAHLVRQVAADQGVQYDESPVPGKDLITFSFKKLDRASDDKLFLAMPKEVFAKIAIIGGAPTGRWLDHVPSSLGSPHEWMGIPSDSFFEVPASKLATAEFWLANITTVPQENAAYFGRSEFKCSASATQYLVRAAYLNGGTGNFELFWAGSALVVSHASLGSATNVSKSALVVCLSKQPTAVYSFTSSAL